MQRIDDAVKHETAYIAINTLLLSAVTESVFLIIGQWNYTVLLGNLLGGVAAVANFFLMGLTVQKALTYEKAKAKNFMKLSQFGRMVMLFGVAVFGLKLECFSPWTTLISLFLPRIALLYRAAFEKKVFKGTACDGEHADLKPTDNTCDDSDERND